MRGSGLTVSGPFHPIRYFGERRGEFDAAVACHHDQGLIAVKRLAFGEAVNVTLGLPPSGHLWIMVRLDRGARVADHRTWSKR
jgi:4-hydroxy-L-threonine phosphate dehydrogenase PdxA